MLNYRLSEDKKVLIISASEELQEELNDAEDSYRSRFDLLCEHAYEPYYTLTTLDRLGHLSEADCFVEELDIHDDGEVEVIGYTYYYPDYMLKDFTWFLARGREVEFIRA